MLELTYIFLHCSDTPATMKVNKAVIDKWHKAQGFDECGYHFLVQQDGSIETGRSLNKVGAAVFGMNKNSIQVCLIGRDRFTEDQLTSALKLISGLIRQHSIKIFNVLGHYEVNANKTCPNVDMKLFRGALQGMREIQQFIKTDFKEIVKH